MLLEGRHQASLHRFDPYCRVAVLYADTYSCMP